MSLTSTNLSLIRLRLINIINNNMTKKVNIFLDTSKIDIIKKALLV